jgi:tetratricopeptide (TPR) repeat protein
MALSRDSGSPYLKWYLVVIYLAIPAIILLTFFSDVFKTKQPGEIPQIVWLAGGLLLMVASIIILAKTIKLSSLLEDNLDKLDKITAAQEKDRATLEQITQSLHLSETAKAVINRDADAAAIRQAVLDKLQVKDPQAASKLIDALDAAGQHKELVGQLRTEVENFLVAGDREKENRLIANIDSLFNEYQWAKAAAQIENFIKTFPNSPQAGQLRQKLLDKKEERKKTLLTLWDDAVKRQATERSLEILRELDMYLTPNEGLALQEAARDVFRTKLHNIGVRFSIAVSGKQWQKALDAGQEIIREFPNSRMAQEIRERIDVLKERVKESANQQPD